MIVQVIKRDGSTMPFEREKVEAAIKAAMKSAMSGVGKTYNIPDIIRQSHNMCTSIIGSYAERESIEPVSVEELQDSIEAHLMSTGAHDAARAFIKYREARANLRTQLADVDPLSLNQYILSAKYARYLPDSGRREIRSETIARTRDMHVNHFKDRANRTQIYALIKSAFEQVDLGRAVPSMRSMQFGGAAIEQNNVRLYNCAYTLMNRTRAFQEIFWCLLGGTGMGLSVRHRHIKHLPAVKGIDGANVVHHKIEDSIEGWADALGALMNSFFVYSTWVEFDYSDIRSIGSLLKTSGGLAPGHLPLRNLLENTRAKLIKCANRKLRSIEVFDIVCHTAKAVLAGGIRRSSLICAFDLGDTEMLHCKAPGNYDLTPGFEVNGQRAMANISAALPRKTTTKEQFSRVLGIAAEGYGGDPGTLWEEHPDTGPNPCVEIGMDPRYEKNWQSIPDMTHLYNWRDYKYTVGDKKRYSWDKCDGFDRLSIKDVTKPDCERVDPVGIYGAATGVTFCNLSEGNVAACRTENELMAAIEAAAVIGTLQAAYTAFAYLGPVTEAIVKRDALLGVSLTGIYDRPSLGLNPAVLERGASIVMQTNQKVAKLLGINMAARCTAVKPSGTASLALTGIDDDGREYSPIASGAHPHHAPVYFRRVTANKIEPPALLFKECNPHAVEVKPDGDLALVFPVRAPDGVPTVKNMPALEHVEAIFTLYDHWIKPGYRRGDASHNVSCTVSFTPEEHQGLIDAMWNNKHRITAMTILPKMSDKIYPYAPREEVVNDADRARWADLVDNWKNVPWQEDGITQKHGDGIHADTRRNTSACEGMMCEIQGDG